MLRFLLPLAFLASLPAATAVAQSETALPPRAYATLDNRPMSARAADAMVERLMAANQVTGLGIAVIRNGKVVFRQSYGYADREAKVPLTPATIMYGASLTKATFAWMMMQLVDEGKVDLDKPIGQYLPRPLPDYDLFADLKGDDRWQRLTLRMLMNHTSGFANLRFFEDDRKLRFHRDPGARFGYSGEGFRLAQLVLEQGLGIDVAAEMQRRVFDRFRMNDTSMTWRDDYAGRLSYGYTDTGERMGFSKRKRADAIGSMDTTLTDWSRFLAGVVRGDGLSRAARAEMVRPSVTIDSAAEFPTLVDARTDQWKPIKLAYAVGWGSFESRFGHAFFKEGHDDGTDNYAVCVDRRQSCILLMANDNRAVRIFVPLVDALLGPVGLPAAWEGYAR
ncbi:serine hydrolase domain-containing protein [Sphingomonas sp.]|jgi:CubicO group peptidase (beta-lactamase class C family)|uniref:serine hydrolase domain-containing protein n=1 Tax=Sphingomonas sp. TaxID=28214 RepID=UPI002E364829|nr:serine hydrolase domain-containing protein [Sphingomonas sp.]HEX4696037.1 serine hydrolase domain-containing protein [Sphingomonas sp.]